MIQLNKGLVVNTNMKKSLDSFNINLIKDKKILIGTPTYENHVMINYHHSIMALQELAILNKINIKYILGTHDALIPRIRNNIIKHFIENDYDYLMFIDSDISFMPQDVLHMIYLSETTDMKVMVGAYPKKNISWSQIQKAIDGGLIKNSEDIQKYSSEFGIRFKNNLLFNPNEPFEIEQGSTGFMLISKQVILDFFINYPEKIGKDYDENTIYVCFETVIDQETKNFLSEDYFFCNMLNKIGHKIWLIPQINLKHLGSTTFSGNVIDFLKNNYK